MSIKIGDKNKIKYSSIGHQYGKNNGTQEKRTFPERHPILISTLASLIVGFILLFSFWGKIVHWIENLM